jgi:hypothetical protein
VFTDPERLIYEPPLSPDAPAYRRYDPLDLELALRVESRGRLNGWLEAAHRYDALRESGAAGDDLAAADAEAADARRQTVAAARTAFGYAAGEVTSATVLDVLYHFLGWLEGKGSAASGTRTSAPPTGGSSPATTGTSSPCT